MSKILVVTGLTGKKSGGGLAQKIADNIGESKAKIPGWNSCRGKSQLQYEND